MNFLSSLGNVKDKLFKSNKQLIFIFILLAIFIGLAIYVYNNYIAGMLDPNYVENNEFIDTTAKTYTEVYFFHTNWCPHCKKAKPIWNQLKDKYDGKIMHDSVLTFKIVNGDDEEDFINDFESRYKKEIDGYPTILLVKNDKVLEYDGKPNYESLSKFVEISL
tara:strand:+ start:2273 stop:2761 length:489 start_codon:yes stop_codon:yes gene_type:complete